MSIEALGQDRRGLPDTDADAVAVRDALVRADAGASITRPKVEGRFAIVRLGPRFTPTRACALAESQDVPVAAAAVDGLQFAAQEGINSPAARAILIRISDPRQLVRQYATVAIASAGAAAIPVIDSLRRIGSAEGRQAALTALQLIRAATRGPVALAVFPI